MKEFFNIIDTNDTYFFVTLGGDGHDTRIFVLVDWQDGRGR